MFKTIKLKKYLDIVEEYIANTTITPGMLVQLHTDGKLKPHATAAGPCLPMFALEDELQGKGIDDNYANLDPVQVWVPTRGDIVYALLKDNENIAIGDFLVSDGAGSLQKYSAAVDLDSAGDGNVQRGIIVAQALEAINLSSSSGTYPETGFRIQVRIM